MKAQLAKGDYRYDALQTLWTFFKEFGEPENNNEYWKAAVDWSKEHSKDELTTDLLLAALNYLDKEIKDGRSESAL